MDDKLSNDTNKPNRVYRLHELNPLAFELLGSDSKNINNNNNNENKMDATNKSLDQPNETNPSDRCNENSQSNASGENSDNNSTDNISLGSDDLIDNIVILPNNFLSDDEQSTNSDDCVYAYRGADGFEPIADDAVNADDETDYLEMDFEPDPVSEVEVDAEVDSRQFNGPNAGANFCPNNAASSTVHTESSSVGVQHEARPSGLDPNSQKGSQEQNSTTGNSGISQPMLMGSSIRQQNNNKIRCCCHLEDGECSNTQHSTNSDNGKTPVTLKKYTGTIPKNTNRQQSRLQRIKPSTSTATPECPSVATDKSGTYSSTSKRSKNDSQKMSSEKSTPESDVAVSIRPIPSPSRSMSFPGEMFLSHAHPSTSGTSTANAQRTGIESYSPSRSHRSHSCLDFTDIVELNRSTATDNIYSTALVSYECSTESILAALKKMKVTTDVSKLEAALQENENDAKQMDITQYLIYMSKKACNYKLIIEAIQRCCENVDVDFYPDADDLFEGIQIPLHEIFSRIPSNANLKKIMAIRNKRFHQMNVFGKIVNAIRRYPDMRADIMYEDYVVVPQYYRSGCILVQKKSNRNEKQ